MTRGCSGSQFVKLELETIGALQKPDKTRSQPFCFSFFPFRIVLFRAFRLLPGVYIYFSLRAPVAGGSSWLVLPCNFCFVRFQLLQMISPCVRTFVLWRFFFAPPRCSNLEACIVRCGLGLPISYGDPSSKHLIFIDFAPRRFSLPFSIAPALAWLGSESMKSVPIWVRPGDSRSLINYLEATCLLSCRKSQTFVPSAIKLNCGSVWLSELPATSFRDTKDWEKIQHIQRKSGKILFW